MQTPLVDPSNGEIIVEIPNRPLGRLEGRIVKREGLLSKMACLSALIGIIVGLIVSVTLKNTTDLRDRDAYTMATLSGLITTSLIIGCFLCRERY